jgi:hypothetical protein
LQVARGLRACSRVSIERVFHCDEKGCRTHIPSMYTKPEEQGWLFVTETGQAPGRTLHFCCWDCLMKHAAQFPPPTRIPVGTVVPED